MTRVRPVGLLCFLQYCALLLMLSWWIRQGDGGRFLLLETMATQETMWATVPAGIPLSLWGQAIWLYGHRLAMVGFLVPLWGLAVCIGITEGALVRERDRWKGFRLTAWRTGWTLLALVPGGVLALGLWPWPLSALLVGLSSAGYLSGVSLLLTYGWPRLA